MRVLGLISGTSVDGIDCALVEIGEGAEGIKIDCQKGQTFPYEDDLRSEIMAVADGSPRSVGALADLDDRIALAFSGVVAKMRAEQPIDLIASHGQTVFHRLPSQTLGYSVQLGRGAVIAQQTGIPTVSNFRWADIKSGGQGAPLVPMLDWVAFTADHARVVQNIGGISNLTFLPANAKAEEVLGFDNAPGNVLLDRAAQFLLDLPFDQGGKTAATGTIDPHLCQTWLNHPFFQMSPPKSTGRELFNHHFLLQCWQEAKGRGLDIPDFLATLTELTARGIIESYDRFLPSFPSEIIVCGGGCHNLYLIDRLSQLASPVPVTTTDRYGIPCDYKEAVAFALLGYLRMKERPGNLPSVTGAKRPVLLGELDLP